MTRRPGIAAMVDFKPSLSIVTGNLATDLRDQIARSTSLPSKQKIAIEMVGRDVILRGEVADDDERRLAESLVRTTPGVGEVRNELIVRNP
jgi:osmotically-inducible protein OsmY